MYINGYKCESCGEWTWTQYAANVVRCAKCGRKTAIRDGLYELKK